MGLKKWISFIVMLAFVVTTMAPLSHAAMPTEPGVKTVKTASHDHHDCHHGEKTADIKKTASADGSCKGKSCCEGYCKCLGNSCNGFAKVLGFNGLTFLFSIREKDQSGFVAEALTSDFTSRLKRPPRA